MGTNEKDDSGGLAFKVGMVDTPANGTQENGGYANYQDITNTSLANNPTWEGMSINVELYCTSMDKLENIFIVADADGSNIQATYDHASPSADIKVWKITPAMITSAGAHEDYARLTLPWDSAIHTGSSYVAAQTCTWIVMPKNVTGADGRHEAGTEQVRLREFGFSKPDSFGWTNRYFKFYSTRIVNEIESLPYEYGSTYGNSKYTGINYKHNFTI